MAEQFQSVCLDDKKSSSRSHVFFILFSLTPIIGVAAFALIFVFPQPAVAESNLFRYIFFGVLMMVLLASVLGYGLTMRRIRRMQSAELVPTTESLLLVKLYIFQSLIPLACLSLLLFIYLFPEIVSERTNPLKLYVLLGAIVLCFALSLLGYSLSKRDMSGTFQQLRDYTEKVDNLNKVSTAISQVHNMDEVYARIIQGTQSLVRAASCYLFTLDETGWVLREQQGRPWEKIPEKEIGNLKELLANIQEDNRIQCFEYDQTTNRKVQAMIVPFRGSGQSQAAMLLIGKKETDGHFNRMDLNILQSLTLQATISIENAEFREVQINYFTHTIGLLVMSLEGEIVPRDHLHNVARFASMISRRLNIEEDERRDIYFAALLHDIGMLKIRRELITQPKHYRQHPILGARLVGRIMLWKDLVPIIRHHHEYFDGTGYPYGLMGPEIPLAARIIGIAEAFDAMTNTNSYRPSMSFSDAMEDLKKYSGTRYDPRLVEIFEEELRANDLLPPIEATSE
ncbi:MAG: HD domain-containing protein [Acidobacteria bacterium]|nr:HD domain-containing protein [Acidobacteriota bacterium]